MPIVSMLAGACLSVVCACSGSGQDGREVDGGEDDDAGTDSDAGRVDACVEDNEAGDAAGSEFCGRAAVEGVINRCAHVTGYLLAPPEAAVGSEVELSATAQDLDGDPVTFRWSSKHGTFTFPDAAETSYRCDVAGDMIVTLTVSDAPRCMAVTEIPVSCLDAP